MVIYMNRFKIKRVRLGEKGFVTQKPSRAHKKRAKHTKIKTQRGGVPSIYIFVCFAHFSSIQKIMKLKFHILF